MSENTKDGIAYQCLPKNELLNAGIEDVKEQSEERKSGPGGGLVGSPAGAGATGAGGTGAGGGSSGLASSSTAGGAGLGSCGGGGSSVGPS